jgi:hypothetical protein
MPGKQRRRCHDEGSPAEPAGCREEEPAGPRHRRTAGSASQDVEFVPKHDDFQVLKVVRPNVQGKELKNAPKHQITKREEHDASC